MLPSVLLPSSPYTDASGSSPMPRLSRTVTITREKVGGGADPVGSASRMMRGEVVRDRPRRADRGDGVLENELVGAVDLDDHGEAIEILDAAFELASVEQMNDDGEAIAARVVQEHVLDVGLSGGRSLFSDLRHQRSSPRPDSSRPRARQGRQTT